MDVIIKNALAHDERLRGAEQATLASAISSLASESMIYESSDSHGSVRLYKLTGI